MIKLVLSKYKKKPIITEYLHYKLIYIKQRTLRMYTRMTELKKPHIYLIKRLLTTFYVARTGIEPVFRP